MFFVLIMGTVSCTHGRKDLVTEDELALPVGEQPEIIRSPGSLWTPSAKFVNMYNDPLARRVGDLIMVQIVESTFADNKVNTDSKRDNNINNSISSFFSLPVSNVGVNATSASELKADGTTQRNGTISAVISARVVRLMPSGNMVISGKKQTRVNDESQYIILSGTIRPEDISPINTIPSNNIADLKLDFYGSGVLGDQQSKGFINRIIDKIWPF
jgi:flagellar L-ring protein precursor FlgH